MNVRLAAKEDADSWLAMRVALWPDENAVHRLAEVQAFFRGETPPTILAAVFLAEAEDGAIVGMLELSLRPYANGCDSSPVPFIEGWFVAPDARRRGVGGALVQAAEQWALAHGYTEMASDALLENTVSERAHAALGFEEVERAIRFRKSLKG